MDTLISILNKAHTQTNQQLSQYLTGLTEILNDTLIAQLHWVMETRQVEQIRLNALWWSEALYSPSLRCGYRELPPPIAAALMAVDLLAGLAKPTPASVGYLLAEAVNRLPKAGFDHKLILRELLESLAKDRGQLSKQWQESQAFIPPPETGRLSLRDLVILVLSGEAQDIDAAFKRTGINGDHQISLPEFAHALFRQEQAVQLAGENQ